MDPLEEDRVATRAARYQVQVRLRAARSQVTLRDMPPSMPPSASDAPSGDEQETERVLSENEQRILDELESAVQSEEEMKSWTGKYRSDDSPFDKDRLARYFVYRGNLTGVKYMVDTEHADLARRDTFKRSAAFYLPENPPKGMYPYLFTLPSFLEGLLYKDVYRELPIHYAVRLEKVDGVEFLLAHDACEHVDFLLKEALRGFDDITSERGMATSLLIAFWRLLQVYPRLLQESPQLLDPLLFWVFPWLSLSEDDFMIWTPRSNSSLERPLKELQADLKSPGGVRLDEGGAVWLHIPWTNGIIVFAAMRRLRRETNLGDGYAEFVNGFMSRLTVFGNRSFYGRDSGNLHYSQPLYEADFDEPNKPRVSLVFPCLMIRAVTRYKQVREITKKLCIATTGDYARSLIQIERTLDETYYPGLTFDNLGRRNNDQVVTKEKDVSSVLTTKEKDGSSTLDDFTPILTVPQLWLWRFGDHLITAGPIVEGYKNRGWMTRIGRLDAPTGIKTGLVLAHLISAFGKTQSYGVFRPPLEIFEASVGRVLSDVEEYTKLSNALPPDKQKEFKFMHRIADIREESAMIQEILSQQSEILLRVIEHCKDFDLPGFSDRKAETWEFLWDRRHWQEVKGAEAEIVKYQKRLAKIDRDAERIEKVIQDQLNLNRTYASIRDARTGLILSAAVIGFTVVTIIFAPLAFMTSLFALPLDSLLQNQVQLKVSDADPTAAYSTAYVGTWFAVAVVATLVITLLFVVLCLWFIGGPGIFASIWELRWTDQATSDPETKDRILQDIDPKKWTRASIDGGSSEIDEAANAGTEEAEQDHKGGKLIRGLRKRFHRKKNSASQRTPAGRV
ncbi:hypothetical protein GGR54DRAFT_634598 [Hypoxylon sp. NC1633]|nr:hypothetical protein GGR54DRAFT_634598 [Hypoxylon sp. NC1633]